MHVSGKDKNVGSAVNSKVKLEFSVRFQFGTSFYKTIHRDLLKSYPQNIIHGGASWHKPRTFLKISENVVDAYHRLVKATICKELQIQFSFIYIWRIYNMSSHSTAIYQCRVKQSVYKEIQFCKGPRCG